jgi:hypothetical protein
LIPGSIFFDSDFHFHDGESGEKLFVVLGVEQAISIVAKTTSQPHGRGIEFGCQSKDRFHNFYLPLNSCYLRKNTWVCLDEFYELNSAIMLQKRFKGVVNHICDLPPELTRDIQNCAIDSEDISLNQEGIISSSLVTP